MRMTPSGSAIARPGAVVLMPSAQDHYSHPFPACLPLSLTLTLTVTLTLTLTLTRQARGDME